MILIFGFGVWFWALFLIEILLLTILVETEYPATSFLSIILFIFFLWWLADIPVWKWIKDNPLTLLKYFSYYIGLGIIWSFCKYYFLLKSTKNSIEKYKTSWNKMKDVDKKHYTSFKEYYKENDYRYGGNISFKKTNTKFALWAIFWPTSCIWTLLNDPIRKIFNYLIYDLFIGIYKKMHKVMIKDLFK